MILLLLLCQNKRHTDTRAHAKDDSLRRFWDKRKDTSTLYGVSAATGASTPGPSARNPTRLLL